MAGKSNLFKTDVAFKKLATGKVHTRPDFTEFNEPQNTFVQLGNDTVFGEKIPITGLPTTDGESDANKIVQFVSFSVEPLAGTDFDANIFTESFDNTGKIEDQGVGIHAFFIQLKDDYVATTNAAGAHNRVGEDAFINSGSFTGSLRTQLVPSSFGNSFQLSLKTVAGDAISLASDEQDLYIDFATGIILRQDVPSSANTPTQGTGYLYVGKFADELLLGTISSSEQIAGDISGAIDNATGSLLNSFTFISSSEQIAGDISGAIDAATGSLLLNNNLLSSSFQIAGDISGAIDAATGSLLLSNGLLSSSFQIAGDISGAIDDATGSFLLNTTDTLTGDLTVTGKLLATEVVTNIVSQSITLATGSNIFGDEITDTHQVTGSLLLTGSLIADLSTDTGTERTPLVIDGDGNVTIANADFATTGDVTITAASVSGAIDAATGSLLLNNGLLSSSFQIEGDISGAIDDATGSILNDYGLLSSSIQIADDISGSFLLNTTDEFTGFLTVTGGISASGNITSSNLFVDNDITASNGTFEGGVIRANTNAENYIKGGLSFKGGAQAYRAATIARGGASLGTVSGDVGTNDLVISTNNLNNFFIFKGNEGSGGGALIISGARSPESGSPSLDVRGPITSSTDISASGMLFASLSLEDASVASQTVMYNTASGKFFFTGSYGGGGGGDFTEFTVSGDSGTQTIQSENDLKILGGTNINTAVTATDTATINLDSRITVTDITASDITIANQIAHTGDPNTGIVFGSDTITLQGNGSKIAQFDTTEITFHENVNAQFDGLFLSGGLHDYGNQNDINATSGFRVASDKAYTHVTPQFYRDKYAIIGVPFKGRFEISEFPNNYVVIGPNGIFVNSGHTGDPTNDEPGKALVAGGGDNAGVGVLQVRGDLEIVPTQSIDGGTTAGIRIAAGNSTGSFNPGIFFYDRDNTSTVSGSFFYSSASAEIRFDTGSRSVKFLAGSTTEDLKEVLHISKSGDNPRIGIGTTDPKTVFDFKDVEDNDTGAELLIRSARTSITGALSGDEGGSINFVIDSGSFTDIKTSGSIAKIKTKVIDVGFGGVAGKLAFELSKTAGGDTADVFEYGYNIGGQSLFAAVQTASLVIKDLSGGGESVLQMRDFSDNIRFEVNDGDVEISGSLGVTGSANFNGGATSTTLTLTNTSAQNSEATSLMINGSGVVGTRELGSNAFTSTTIGTTTNALTVDDATLQLNSGTTFDGSAAKTISIKDGGVDSDALAADISVTTLTTTHITASGNISSSGTITAATLDATSVSDTLAAAIVAEIDNDEIPIAKLAEDAVTVTAGTGLSGGGSVTLGSSITINSDGLLSSSAQIASDISGSFIAASASFSTRVTANETITAKTLLSSSAQIASDISGSFTAVSAALASDIVSAGGGTTTNALTVDNATLQLNSGTTFDGSAARTISIKDGGVDSDALASNITVTQLTASAVSASGTITANSFTGNGLSINGPQNSHIEVGTYNVGFDTAGLNTLFITGSGLIVSGAMADTNHHNMVKIGNVELIDLDNAVSPNEFLIHNVNSLKITSGSDGGDIANDDGRLFEHNGTDFTLYRNNSSAINAAANGTLTFNGENISFVATSATFMRATNNTPGANGHLIFTEGNPNTTPSELRSINWDSAFPFLGGAITASAVSASGTITAATLDAAAVSDTLAAAIVAEIDNDEIPIAKLAEDSISGVALGSNLNNLTVDNATLQLNSGTTYNGSAARTISIKDGGVDSDALADDITVAGTLTVADDIQHSGDTDTKIAFSTDVVSIKAGNTSVFESSATGSVLPNVHQNIFDTGSLALSANSALGDIIKMGDSSTVAGGLYFLNSAGGWTLANASSISTGASSSLAVAVGTNSTTHGMCLRGLVNPFDDPTDAPIGGQVFMSDNANGRITGSAPSDTNDIVRVVGHRYGTDLVYFNPSNDFIVHA